MEVDIEEDIVVKPTGGKYDGQELRFDVWLVKSAAEKHEDRLQSVKDSSGVERITADAKFCADLSRDLAELGMPCTPKIASKVWVRANEILSASQKKTNEKQNSPSGTESTPTS